MALYALDDIDDALEATRAFLTPVDRATWVKLAIVTFFVGLPGGNVNAAQFPVGGDGGAPGFPAIEPTPRLWLLLAVAVVAVLVVALVFALVGSVMEFVFVESLRNEAVTIRRYWSRRWRQGLRLFGFRLVLGAFVFGGILLSAVVGFLLFDASALWTGVTLLVLLLPIVLGLVFVAGLVNGFTTVFVVPVMVLEDCGVLDGWRRLWPTIVDQWKQYLAYAVVSVFLSFFGGVLVGFVTALLALVLLVPFGILFGVGLGALVFVAEPLGIAVLAVVGILFLLALLAVVALVQVPVQTYLRYYALLVLGDVDADLDLIPERRAAVRSDSDSDSDPDSMA